MTPAHLLDAVIGAELPTLRSAEHVAAFESTPTGSTAAGRKQAQ